MGIEVGARARLIADPSTVGVLTANTRSINGRLYRGLRLADGGEKLYQEELLEIAPTAADALSDLETGRWSAPDDLRRLLTHVRLTGRLADLVYSMESTNTEFHAYQFKPLVKVLGSPTRGLLIADEVGLGKTIEAGLVWTELVARYDAHRLLVVCPKSLQDKWLAELWNKFGVKAQPADAADLLRILKEQRETNNGFAVVATLSGLRPPAGWDTDEDLAGRAQTKLARLLTDHVGDDPLFDMVVFDEAHHLRNPETQQHKLARLVVNAADYKLMLSATPINLKSDDLRAILQLLDPQLFDRPWIFDELHEQNQPLIQARETALNPNTSLSDVSAVVHGIFPGDLLRTDRRLHLLKQSLRQDPETDTPARRAEIAARLEEMSMLGGLVNRTRRRDVADIRVRRRAESALWRMSDAERDFYERATRAIQRYAFQRDVNDKFLLSNAQRMLASCLPAAWRGWADAAADSLAADDDEDDPEANGATARRVGPLVGELAGECRDESEYRALRAGDSKAAGLLEALDSLWAQEGNEKIIVFSSFRRTIDYLDERLREARITAFKMHGSIKVDRTELLNRFEEAEGRAVLLTSEVGGEGLDLQFSRCLINYDLPWNPMKVEQRVGRIDRIGQASPTVQVLSLICEETIEERIYERLYQRLNLIEATLGGFEPILGPILKELERKFLEAALTPDELDEELRRKAGAAENRKLTEEKIEAEAAGLIAHGDLVLQRIRKAHDQHRWIQPQDLREYLRDGLDAFWPGCRLDRAPTPWEAYDLELTAAAGLAFADYLRDRGRRTDTRLRRDARVRVTFARLPTGVRPSAAEFVSPPHPLVRFVAGRRSGAMGAGGPRPALCARIGRDLVPSLAPGVYGLAVQRWSVSGQTTQVRLVYGAYDLARGRAVDDDTAETMATTLLSAPYRPFEPGDAQVRSATSDIRSKLLAGRMDVAEAAFVEFEEAEDADRRATLHSVLQRQKENERRRVGTLIADYQARGGGAARLIPAERKKLEYYLARIDRRIEEAERSAPFHAEPSETLAIALVEVA